MSAKTKIEWTQATWNPIRGCSRVSEGCRNCYAEKVAARFSGKGQAYEGLAVMKNHEARWTGKVQFVKDALELPLRWKKPRRVFVNSMSDLFHEGIPDDQISSIFCVMEAARRHTFQILTKRPERMLAWVAKFDRWLRYAADTTFAKRLPNVWIGVSVEDQKTADGRIPLLLQTPAAVRWVSYEPALGPVDFRRWLTITREREFMINWLVAGGESGPGARPMHPDWVRSVRDQCQAAGVPFFFKQWGEWIPGSEEMRKFSHEGRLVPGTENCGYYCDPWAGHVDHKDYVMMRVGKKVSGRLLDGASWDEYPKETHGA